MCIICLEFWREKLTIAEAYRNLSEMREDLPPEHVEEIEGMLEYETMKEVEKLQEEQDEDYEWWEECGFGD